MEGAVAKIQACIVPSLSLLSVDLFDKLITITFRFLMEVN